MFAVMGKGECCAALCVFSFQNGGVALVVACDASQTGIGGILYPGNSKTYGRLKRTPIKAWVLSQGLVGVYLGFI